MHRYLPIRNSGIARENMILAQDRKQKFPFRNVEILCYFGVWIISVFYSIYRVYFIQIYFENYNDLYNDFGSGWKIFRNKIDISDEEWRIWIPFITNKLSIWISVHVLISQTIKYYLNNNKSLLCCWYITISTLFLWYYFGILSMLCTLLIPCISSLLIALRNKFISWIVHLLILVFIYWAKISDKIFRDFLLLEDEDYFLLTSTICWIQLRSISYSIDNIESYQHENVKGFLINLLQNLAYSLYLPTLTLGPIILYQDFINGINKPFCQWSRDRLCNIILNLARYIFWMYFTECILHFFYFNVLQYHPNIVAEFDPWVLYGYGYCMGQYFLNKYVVIYGLSSTICKTDDIDGPPQPKCIGRIHLYTDMWKHFDRGLYKFLVKYIYIPCNPKTILQKFAASALCFAFVYIWHGMQFYIFIWAFLNFVGVVIEQVAKLFGNRLYQNKPFKYWNADSKRRFECCLASPLLAISAISNFFFFAGYDIGKIFLEKFFSDPWKTKLTLLGILYCCCQVSTVIKNYEKRTLDQYTRLTKTS